MAGHRAPGLLRPVSSLTVFGEPAQPAGFRLNAPHALGRDRCCADCPNRCLVCTLDPEARRPRFCVLTAVRLSVQYLHRAGTGPKAEWRRGSGAIRNHRGICSTPLQCPRRLATGVAFGRKPLGTAPAQPTLGRHWCRADRQWDRLGIARTGDGPPKPNGPSRSRARFAICRGWSECERGRGFPMVGWDRHGDQSGSGTRLRTVVWNAHWVASRYAGDRCAVCRTSDGFERLHSRDSDGRQWSAGRSGDHRLNLEHHDHLADLAFTGAPTQPRRRVRARVPKDRRRGWPARQ